MPELCLPLLPLLLLGLAAGDLLPPQNLTLHTLNTFYILHWDWADASAANQTVRFSAEFLPEFQSKRAPQDQRWTPVCSGVLERRCDFTPVALHYLGRYLLRVRASAAPRSSAWSQISFCPDEDAALGPPSRVSLRPGDGSLEVSLAEPLSSTNESMRTILDQMSFLIQHWRHEEGEQAAQVLPTENNVVVLRDLDRWTMYCVRVQSHRDFDNKTSVFSDTHCTETRGRTPHWQLFVYFLLSLLVCFLLVLLLAFSYYKGVRPLKGVFFPSSSLPAYIQELWSEGEAPRLLLAPASPEPVCECMCVVSRTEEECVRSSSPEDQDCSSGSSDSGVYSTEEDSHHTRDGSASAPHSSASNSSLTHLDPSLTQLNSSPSQIDSPSAVCLLQA